jgi:hypothetical protein
MYRRIGLALLMAVSLAACGGVTDPSQNQQQSFSPPQPLNPGQGNFNSFSFTVSKSGELSITVTSMTPTIPTSTFFEVGFGNSVSGSCQPLQINQHATVGTAAISGYPITPGSYCVFLIDEGLFTVPETYTMVVSHP